VNKVKGKASDEIEVDTDVLLSLDICVNPNWTPIAALIRQAAASINTYVCKFKDPALCETNDFPQNFNLVSSASATCTLPAEFTLDNLPPDGTLPLPEPHLQTPSL
jgi:hypothetical protein